MPRNALPPPDGPAATADADPGRTSRRASGTITLEEVAKLAGVSPITVSRVINQPDLVSPATIEKVQKVINRTGYVPNLLAGGLASRRSKLVAAVVPTITNTIFAETVQSLTDRLGRAGYQVLLGLSNYPGGAEDLLINTILSRRPDALFLTGINHSADVRQRILAARIPVVETWDYTPTPLDMLVGFSHERSGEAVGDYLVSKGYRSFGLVWADDERAAARRRGFLSALARHGIQDVPVSVVPAPGTLRLGREGLGRLLNAGHRIEAVFCSSDALAQGVLTEAQARGLAVPSQLAVMGYGDLDFAAYTYPPLSTVRIERTAMGSLAADALLARMAGKEPPFKVLDLGFELIERGTT